MRRWGVALALLVSGCTQVEPSGRPLAPVADGVAASTVGAPTAPANAPVTAEAPVTPGGAGGFDFEGDDRTDDKAAPDDVPLSDAEIAAALGLAKVDPNAPVAPVGPPPPVEVAPVAPSAPAFPPPPVNWGVRLVSTVIDAQPPRAILGLADGTETVVQPGDLLPAAHLVVLAIGRDAVQIAQITPEGDHARVDTYVVTALFPAGVALPK